MGITKEDLPAKRAELRAQNIAQTEKDIRASLTPDEHIIQAMGLIESTDKVLNALTKKTREWYKEYWPELEHEHKDHGDFVEAALQAGTPETTMGGTFSDEDRDALLAQLATLQQLRQQRESLLQYLEQKMQAVAPNLTAVAGATIGAQLLQQAGSLRKMAMMAAGTIQVLGAEAALFRHLRNKKASPPKHGIIFNHPSIQRTQKRGRAARVLADTIAIAVKVDYFDGEYIGDELRRKLE